MKIQSIKSALNDGVNWFSKSSTLRQPMYRVVTALDPVPRVEKYLAPLGVAVLMADVLGRDLHEDIERVRRMVLAADGPFTEEVQAARDWVAGELLA